MTRTVVGIDPGLASTGVVVIQDGRVVHVKTISTEADGPRPEFESVIERGLAVSRAVIETFDDVWNVVAVAVEGYEDFGGGHLRSRNGKPIPNRWTTPAVCALIGATLIAKGYPVVWQKASLVMTHYKPYKDRWAAKQYGILPGDEKLTNDHLRSAACHALAWMDANRQGVTT